MKGFDISNEIEAFNKIQVNQETNIKKEFKHLGSLLKKKGQKVWGLLNGEIFEVELLTRAKFDLKGKPVIRHKATIPKGTIITFAINRKNAIKKYTKANLLK